MITAIVGGQYGSEGKGAIAAHIADRYDICVRTGGPNAGHTFYMDDKAWKMQSIPVGWCNPNADIVIGAGAVINPRLLLKEVEETGCGDRVMVDPNALIITDQDVAEEGGIKGDMHRRIGSTGEGVGAARIKHISRDGERRLVRDHQELQDLGYVHDTVEFLNGANENEANIMLEGTQGIGLSLFHGQWPYVTSADTTPAALASAAGVPARDVECLLVFRTFPIRVAGNSGPMYCEITWEDMSEYLGRPVSEVTTVTNKVRRIGAWDEDLALKSIAMCRPSEIALTFLDYIDPSCYGERELGDRGNLFVQYLKSIAGAPVKYLGTGPRTIIER